MLTIILCHLLFSICTATVDYSENYSSGQTTEERADRKNGMMSSV
jgi:hypothetical protein